MKLLQTVSSKIEADIICGKLESLGIRAFSTQDAEGGLNGALMFSNGVKIFVSDDDLENAKKAILID
ncbi:MAG: DUF2007 domain-containing protein [Pseudobdellovibrionaceae bacterium]|nr:DUF2007 domain-containing protein [Pseudobdellovibrionaceae bacterium]